MFREPYELILSRGARLVYGAGEAFAACASGAGPSGVHSEACINEKAAFELALAGAITGKRTACLFSVEGVYEALDPLMSSAYTGVKGGFVVACVKDGALDVTPLGPFSKLPVLVSDGRAEDLGRTLAFAFDLSARHEIPCLVETLPVRGAVAKAEEQVKPEGVSRFVKNPARWAPIPKFRYDLHKGLNEKVEKIREEFETYQGNGRLIRGKRGVITHLASDNGAVSGDESLLALGSVFPLPLRTVASFLDEVEEARIAEGPFPAIAIQVGHRRNLSPGGVGEHPGAAAGVERAEAFGFTVVRDELGPASSLNMAHGMACSGSKEAIMAVTDEDAFLHSGLPAFVNTLYNGSAYLLVIRTKGGAESLSRVFDGFGFGRYFSIKRADEVERYKEEGGLTVLFYEGEL